MKKVITYGTFDLFHRGHLEILRRCKQLGDHLTVAISTDEFNLSKGKKAEYSFEDRSAIVSSIVFVDSVIEESCWDQKQQDIINNQISIFAMGDDWEGKFDFLSNLCEVIYFPRTPNISSTLIKQNIKK